MNRKLILKSHTFVPFHANLNQIESEPDIPGLCDIPNHPLCSHGRLLIYINEPSFTNPPDRPGDRHRAFIKRTTWPSFLTIPKESAIIAAIWSRINRSRGSSCAIHGAPSHLACGGCLHQRPPPVPDTYTSHSSSEAEFQMNTKIDQKIVYYAFWFFDFFSSTLLIRKSRLS